MWNKNEDNNTFYDYRRNIQNKMYLSEIKMRGGRSREIFYLNGKRAS